MFGFDINLTVSQLNTLGWCLLMLVDLLIDAVTIVHILMNKKDEPSSAILWTLVVLTIPVMGVAAYLVLGINNFKSTSNVKKSNELIIAEALRLSGDAAARVLDGLAGKAPDKPEYSSILIKRLVAAELATGLRERRERRAVSRRLFLRGSAPEPYDVAAESALAEEHVRAIHPLIEGNALDLLEDGTKAYPRMLAAIKEAKSTIHLQSYIINYDQKGAEIFNALEEKTREGVEVRVLFDRMGSASLFRQYLRRTLYHWLYRLGGFKGKPRGWIHVDLQAFSGVSLLAPWRLQHRNHRKVMIVDSRRAFVGGINISADNDARIAKSKTIHDLHAEVIGPAVGMLQFFFLRDWCYASGSPPDTFFSERYFPPQERHGDSRMHIVASGPGQSYAATEKLFMTAATSSRKSLAIITPYFVPDKSFIQALCMASARGVEVKVIIPRNNNHWYVRFATSGFYETLLDAGVRVFEKKGRFSHAKAMLVDGAWGVMGSSNCDYRSFRINYELDFTAQGGAFIEMLNRQFALEEADSEEIKLPLDKRFHEELLEGVCSLLAPIL